MAIKILKERPYSFLTLRLSKGKEVTRLESKEEYLFDISKIDQIFYYLLRDQQIKLPNRHKIPSPEELKNRKYCKWHHSFSHAIMNCIMFKNVIQKALKKESLN